MLNAVAYLLVLAGTAAAQFQSPQLTTPRILEPPIPSLCAARKFEKAVDILKIKFFGALSHLLPASLPILYHLCLGCIIMMQVPSSVSIRHLVGIMVAK